MTFEEYLKEVLTYNKDTGEFFWIKPGGARVLSKPAGGKNSQGYIQIEVSYGGKRNAIYAHRLAFLFENGSWPEKVVDHKNGNPSDNRIENLRQCDQRQNVINTGIKRDNTIGYKGLRKLKNGKYIAVYKNGKQMHIGTYLCPRDAAIAYDKAILAAHGEFAKTNASMGLL
jgi:hypothetical protein